MCDARERSKRLRGAGTHVLAVALGIGLAFWMGACKEGNLYTQRSLAFEEGFKAGMHAATVRDRGK